MSNEQKSATRDNPIFANRIGSPTREAIPEQEINARCDAACPAGAQVRVDLNNSHVLYFCGHHYNENAFELISVTVVMRDERKWRPEDPSFVPKVESKEPVPA